jgi:hypothetical protein
MLRSELPGVKISDATIHAFTADATKGRHARFGPKLKALSMASQVVGYSGILAALGDSFEFEKFRRNMLTLFLFSTDFFQLPDPRARELTYVGMPTACTDSWSDTSSRSIIWK